MNDWTREQQLCMAWAGCKFIATFCGYIYQWQADNVIYARTGDRKPYLVATPVKRMHGQRLNGERIPGKKGWLRAPQIFHAENLPSPKL